MLDELDRRNDLGLRVGETDVAEEALVGGDVDVLVDRRRDDVAAEAIAVRRQIGAAAAEREANGRARDDHDAAAFRDRCASRSASPGSEPISKNRSPTTKARKRPRRARSAWSASRPLGPSGKARTAPARS